MLVTDTRGGSAEVERRPLNLEAGLAAATVGAIAVANPLLGIVAGGALAYTNNLLVKQWIDAANEKLERAGRVLNPDDPASVAAFNRLTIGALQTARTEKRLLLADALVGALSGSTPDFLQEVFADLAVRYSPEHVAILRMINAPGDTVRAYGEQPNPSLTLSAFLQGSILRGVEEPELVRDQIGDDLHRDGLVVSRFGPAMNVMTLGPAEVTERGHRFLTYLSPPL